MQTIHINDIEQYHPGYKDRTLTWAKIYFKLITNPKYKEIPEVDRFRFIAFIILELFHQEPIPNDAQYFKGLGFNLRKRPISLTLQMLQKYITVCNGENEKPVSQSRVEKSRVEKNIYGIFDEARKLYPETKRGLATEFENFRTKHKDWQQSLPLLLPAITRQIEFRKWAKKENARRRELHKERIFVPAWKHFKTWINNRCWEQSLPNEFTDALKQEAQEEQYQEQEQWRKHELLKEQLVPWAKEQTPEYLRQHIKANPHHRKALEELRPELKENRK